MSLYRNSLPLCDSIISMHDLKHSARNTLKSDEQGKSNGTAVKNPITSIRSPDSTCIDSDYIPSSTSCPKLNTPGPVGRGMSTNEPLRSPPRKETSPNSKVTPQSVSKAEVRSTSKRKLFSSPSLSHDEDDKKCTPKRKRTAEPACVGTTPKSANRLSVPLSERQQMALLMQMTSAEASDILRSPVSTSRSPKESSQNRKLNKRNEKGETPLHSATIKGDGKLVRKLIRQGADINSPDFAGWTPLHEACNHGWYDISKYLLRAGAEVNVKGLDDDTPLHDASINGHRKLVALLVKSGANPLQVNSRGKSAVDVATTDEVLKILKREIVPSSSDDDESANEEPRSPTSPESDLTDAAHDDAESVHSTSKDNDETFPLTSNHQPISAAASAIEEEEEDKAEESLPLPDTVKAYDSENPQSSASSTMRKASPPQHINKGIEKPSSPRLTLRFQSIRTKEPKNNLASSSSKCVPGVVSSTEQKYPSYSVTMETKDDVYEFKQDTPPPMPLSTSRVPPISAATCSSFEPCDSQSEPVDTKKDCDSSTPDKPGCSDSTTSTSLCEEKVEVVAQSSASNNESPQVDSNFASDEEMQKKRRKEDISPGPQGVVSSTSKSGLGGSTDSPKPDTDKSVEMEVEAADTTEKTDKSSPMEISSVSSSVSPPLTSNAPKVPPLKIVIPQTSEPDCKDKNKMNSARQALPYVVNSTATAESIESSVLYSSSSGSQTTDSVRVTYSKSMEQQSSNSIGSDATPERTSQRVTRSSHRMQAALANVGQGGSDTNVDGGRNSADAADDVQPQTIGMHPRKRKLRSRDPNANITNNSESNHSSASSTSSHDDQPTMNCYHMYLDIRRQIDKRRKNLFVVQPKAPQGYKNYLINRCSYVLEGNASSRLSVPMIPPPQSLTGALKDLFLEQENERYKLRLQHLIEREKLVLSVEQEILRVHTRAARAMANQAMPLSICTILKDEEIYNTLEPEQDDKDKHVRSRYNGRLFLSWLQDVDDKWDKIKRAMLLRHHNEAESLHAVQKMSWEWKMKEVGTCDLKTTPVIDDLNVPMVSVNDDFDLLPA